MAMESEAVTANSEKERMVSRPAWKVRILSPMAAPSFLKRGQSCVRRMRQLKRPRNARRQGRARPGRSAPVRRIARRMLQAEVTGAGWRRPCLSG